MRQFQPKLEQVTRKKMLKFVLFHNYFSDPLTEVQIWYWKPFKFGLQGFFRKIKQLFASNLPQTPSNFICLIIFVTLRPLTQFQLKITANNMQKCAQWLDDYFSNLLTEFEIWWWKPFNIGLRSFFRKMK